MSLTLFGQPDGRHAGRVLHILTEPLSQAIIADLQGSEEYDLPGMMRQVSSYLAREVIAHSPAHRKFYTLISPLGIGSNQPAASVKYCTV